MSVDIQMSCVPLAVVKGIWKVPTSDKCQVCVWTWIYHCCSQNHVIRIIMSCELICFVF